MLLEVVTLAWIFEQITSLDFEFATVSLQYTFRQADELAVLRAIGFEPLFLFLVRVLRGKLVCFVFFLESLLTEKPIVFAVALRCLCGLLATG